MVSCLVGLESIYETFATISIGAGRRRKRKMVLEAAVREALKAYEERPEVLISMTVFSWWKATRKRDTIHDMQVATKGKSSTPKAKKPPLLLLLHCRISFTFAASQKLKRYESNGNLSIFRGPAGGASTSPEVRVQGGDDC